MSSRALLASLATLVAGCSGEPPAEVTEALAGQGTPAGRGAVWATTSGVEITTTQQPSTAVTVELPVAPAAYADLPVAVDGSALVLHKHGTDPVEVLVGRLDRSRGVVSVRTATLSWFGALLPSTKALAGGLGKIVDGAFSSVLTDAPKPDCDGERTIRAAGWGVASRRGRPSAGAWVPARAAPRTPPGCRSSTPPGTRCWRATAKGMKVTGTNLGQLPILA